MEEPIMINHDVGIAEIILYEESLQYVPKSRFKTVIAEYPSLARDNAVCINCRVGSKCYDVLVKLKEDLPPKVVDAILYSIDASDFVVLIESALREYLNNK